MESIDIRLLGFETDDKRMAAASKVEFTGGTLYFAPIDGTGGGVVGTMMSLEEINMTENVVEAAEVPVYINKIVHGPCEFEGTCEIKFRGLVKLLGFWPAVKFKLWQWREKTRRLLHG